MIGDNTMEPASIIKPEIEEIIFKFRTDVDEFLRSQKLLTTEETDEFRDDFLFSLTEFYSDVFIDSAHYCFSTNRYFFYDDEGNEVEVDKDEEEFARKLQQVVLFFS